MQWICTAIVLYIFNFNMTNNDSRQYRFKLVESCNAVIEYQPISQQLKFMLSIITRDGIVEWRIVNTIDAGKYSSERERMHSRSPTSTCTSAQSFGKHFTSLYSKYWFDFISVTMHVATCVSLTFQAPTGCGYRIFCR